MTAKDYREEQDLLGEKKIANSSYSGIHTQRAYANFHFSSYAVNWRLIQAYALIKRAAAEANAELGYLEKKKAAAIIEACRLIEAGEYKDQFRIDALQGGAGTSTNMNLNEVIANIALEKLGYAKGQYEYLNPLDDVNMHQSTNDTYPTALRLALIRSLGELEEEIEKLQGAFQKKEKEFFPLLKIGRTQLQEAVPFSLGAEFSAFSQAVARDRWRVFKARERLRQANLGGTAIGTGIGAPRRYIFLVWEKIHTMSGVNLCRSENLIDATANADSFTEASGILKTHAVNLVKIANDLRRLSLLKEIKLPLYQAGSSLMPGKVNPVILEAAVQIGIKVRANDFIVSECAALGTFQINEFLPLLGFAFLESVDILTGLNRALAEYIEKIEANAENCSRYLYATPRLVTAFLPEFGYHRLEKILEEFRNSQEKGKNFLDFLERKLGKEKVAKRLNPYSVMSLGYERENT